MFRVQSLILVLISFAILVRVTCHSRSVAPHAAIVTGSTTCPTPNDNCSCTQYKHLHYMYITCYASESFPVFSPLRIKFTILDIIVSGTFEEVPSECISPLIGEGTVANLLIHGSTPYPYTKLKVNSTAFVTDYAESTTVTFYDYDFSLIPTEALTVPNILSAGFHSCQIPVINNNSFSNFGGNELYLLDSGIEQFEQYAFNGTGTFGAVKIGQNPFSRFDSAFKLLRVKELNVTNSNVSTIPDYAFCECNVLNNCTNIIQILILSYNPLVSISDLAFANLPELIALIMDNCLLVKIPTVVINTLPSLIGIDLSNNQITEVELNSFVNLQHLQTLNLKGNPIIVIQPGAFDGLPWVDLDISNFDTLTSVDAAVTYGMNNVSDLNISNCPNFEEITLNNYTQLPDSLNWINASSLSIKRVSSNFDYWLQLKYINLLDISDNYNYDCIPDIRWMAKYVFCPNVQIVMINTTCASTNQLVKDYLAQLVNIPNCIQHTVPMSTTLPNAGPSSAILMENSSKFFVLCTLLLFCLFT